MKPRDPYIDPEYLRSALDYDRYTGVFRWKTPRPKIVVGSIAGQLKHDGYWMIKLDGRMYLAHRLAWLFIYGKWPDEYLDHINMNRSDNRIPNLREATYAQNQHNTKSRKNNTLGFKGVTAHGRKYRASIRLGGKPTHLGLFATPQEASAAYWAAASSARGDFARC